MAFTSFRMLQGTSASQEFMSATGGTITTSGDYKVHSFTSSGTFTPTTGTDSSYGTIVEYLNIAGGAGGAGQWIGGGGGAGGSGSGSSPGTHGTANLGGGGHGSLPSDGLSNGGSGVVIIKYKFQ